MLLNHFYTLVSSEPSADGKWTVRVRLNPAHPVYQGHFPHHPVVPGVCMLQLIKECTEHLCRQRLQYAQVSSCKFLSVVRPEEQPDLSLSLHLQEAAENTLRLQAEGTAGDNRFIKLKATLIRKA